MITNKDIPTEKILKEIAHMATKIKGWYTSNLTPHDQESLINHSYMLLHSKFIDGSIPYHKLEEYKGYMFLTVRNTILKYYKYKDTAYSWRNQEYFEDGFNCKTDDMLPGENIDTKVIYKVIEDLSSPQRDIIKLQIQGYKQKEIAEKLGLRLKDVKYLTQLAKNTIKTRINYKKPKAIYGKPLSKTIRSMNRKRDHYYILTLVATGQTIRLEYLSEVMRYIGWATTTSEKALRASKRFQQQYTLQKVMHAEGQQE